MAFLLVIVFGYVISLTHVSEGLEKSNIASGKLYSTLGYYEITKNGFLPSALEVSSRNALNLMINNSIENKSFYTNSEFNDIFSNLVTNGTSNSLPGYEMKNKSMEYFINLNENFSRKIFLNKKEQEINITLIEDSIKIKQETPWEIEVYTKINFRIKSEFFNIKSHNSYIKNTVSINDLNDPYIGIKSNGTVLQKFKNSSNEKNEWDIDKLKYYLDNRIYLQNNNGMSFLMRMQNKSPDNKSFKKNAKITSFIHPEDVINDSYKKIGIDKNSAKKRSYIDHYFFNNTFKDCDIAGIDEYTERLYNISDISDNPDYKGFRLDFNSAVDFTEDIVNNATITCSSEGVD
ncbi:MAG: hypothetical protein ACQER9_03465 [Nanobdellota archaeon]